MEGEPPSTVPRGRVDSVVLSPVVVSDEVPLFYPVTKYAKP